MELIRELKEQWCKIGDVNEWDDRICGSNHFHRPVSGCLAFQKNDPISSYFQSFLLLHTTHTGISFFYIIRFCIKTRMVSYNNFSAQGLNSPDRGMLFRQPRNGFNYPVL